MTDLVAGLLTLQFTNPTLYAILKMWPLTVLIPAVVIGIVLLATATRMWEARDRRKKSTLFRD